MAPGFLLYGSTGFVGDAIARLAVQRGLQPIIAGRNAAKMETQAAQLGLECRVFSLDDSAAMDKALSEVDVVLHCAGPYIHTYKPMVEACLRTGTHYLDITGELPVLEALAAMDLEAKKQKIMLLPAAGIDAVADDCLALHLKQRLPSATRLTLAFQFQGPARLPPGTIATVVGQMPSLGGVSVFRDGRLQTIPISIRMKTRWIDFGKGPVKAMLLPWAGDVYVVFRSTGFTNIELYPVHTAAGRRQLWMMLLMRPLLRLGAVRRFFESREREGPTTDELSRTFASFWGEVEDDQGRKAASRLHGPEAGVTWTSLAALAVVRKVLAGEAPPGFQTPALAYGPDFILECEGVTREDLD